MMEPRAEPLRVLELYSGIGGMHLALARAGVPAQVVAAVDINTAAGRIYRHNFPLTPLWNKSIEGIPVQDFDQLRVDLILMSPPCQPFTRLGLKRDLVDPRTKSFLYLLDVLPKLNSPPRFLLLENVKGFEESSARDRLVETLSSSGYSFREVLVSPTSVGIPNSRLRYFLIARRSEGGLGDETQEKILEAFNLHDDTGSTEPSAVLCPGQTETQDGLECDSKFLYKLETRAEVQRKQQQDRDGSIRQIRDFLDPDPDLDLDQYLLPPKTLLRYGLILDIVEPDSRRSVCFTKNYGRYVEGTGSVLQTSQVDLESVFTGLDQLSEEERLRRLQTLQLRYFTPREVANLMGFPQSFSFPQDVPLKQRYKVLGNSLNVLVVSKLLQILLSEQL